MGNIKNLQFVESYKEYLQQTNGELGTMHFIQDVL